MDHIYRHPSGGELWQGGVHDVRAVVGGGFPQKIHMIVLSAQEEIPKLRVPEDRFEVIQAPLVDTYNLSREAITLTAAIANMAANELANTILAGKNGLSSCAAGRNRSGMISALVLMKVAGYQPEEAVAIVRRQRVGADGPALSNELFVAILRAMRDAVGEMMPQKRPR